MSIGNPHFYDDQTGSMFVLDDSGWERVRTRYTGGSLANLTIDELRAVYESIFNSRRSIDQEVYTSILSKIKLHLNEGKQDTNASGM